MVARLLTTLLLLALVFPVAAQEGLHSARVPVADRGEAALTGGIRNALRRVLIRVSGNDDIVDKTGVAAAILGARDRVASYSYQQEEAQVYLSATFDDVLVKGILRDSDGTFWAQDRPPVLLWLVVDEPFSRRFATVSQDDELLTALSQGFADRGVTLRLPLLDLEDAAALSPEMVWQSVTSRIRAASERYGTEHILVGRYVRLTTGALLADWLYLDTETQRREQVQGNVIGPVVYTGVDLSVDAMADRYAVTLESRAPTGYVTVVVSGVESYLDYRSVMDIFRDLPLLESVSVAEVQGDILAVRVTGISSTDALKRVLPSRSRLAVSDDMTPSRMFLHWGRP